MLTVALETPSWVPGIIVCKLTHSLSIVSPMTGGAGIVLILQLTLKLQLTIVLPEVKHQAPCSSARWSCTPVPTELEKLL